MSIGTKVIVSGNIGTIVGIGGQGQYVGCPRNVVIVDHSGGTAQIDINCVRLA